MAIDHIVFANVAVLENQAWTIMFPAPGLRPIVFVLHTDK